MDMDGIKEARSNTRNLNSQNSTGDEQDIAHQKSFAFTLHQATSINRIIPKDPLMQAVPARVAQLASTIPERTSDTPAALSAAIVEIQPGYDLVSNKPLTGHDHSSLHNADVGRLALGPMPNIHVAGGETTGKNTAMLEYAPTAFYSSFEDNRGTANQDMSAPDHLLQLTKGANVLRHRRKAGRKSSDSSEDDAGSQPATSQFISVPEPAPRVQTSRLPHHVSAFLPARSQSLQGPLNLSAIQTETSSTSDWLSQPPVCRSSLEGPSPVPSTPGSLKQAQDAVLAALPPTTKLTQPFTSASLASQASLLSPESAASLLDILQANRQPSTASDLVSQLQPNLVVWLQQALLQYQHELHSRLTQPQLDTATSAKHISPLHSSFPSLKESPAAHTPASVTFKEPPKKEEINQRLEVFNALAIFPSEVKKDDKQEGPLDGDEDDDEMVEAEPSQDRTMWYQDTEVVVFMVTIGMGLVLLAVGLVLHFTLSYNGEGDVEVFRYFYFFAAWPLLWYVTRFVVAKTFLLVEWWYYRDALYYFTSLQRSASWLLFFIVTLPWFTIVFRLLWCKRYCQTPGYRQVTNVIWSIALCLMLFALANFIKSCIAKYMSTTFYRTAHFKKLKAALEKEHYLLILSRRREEVEAERATEKEIAERHTDVWFNPMNLVQKTGSLLGAFKRKESSRSIMPVADPPAGVVAEQLALQIEPVQADAADAHKFGVATPASVAVAKDASPSPCLPLPTGAMAHNSLPFLPVSMPADRLSLPTGDPPASTPLPAQVDQHLSKQGSFRSIKSKAPGLRTEIKVQEAGLSHELLNTVPHQKQDVSRLTDAELDRLRTSIVIKTYSALLRKHLEMSSQQQEEVTRAIKRFAKGLFYNIQGDQSRDYLTLEDFEFFFADARLAEKALKVFDTDNNEKVSRNELKETVTAIYKERNNIAQSLRDTDSIVSSLEAGVGMCIHFVFLAFYLLVFGVDILAGFSTFSATVLALTFVFGNSVKNMFESMLFLFVEHPYDVGDCIFLNNEMLRVKKISLLYTEMVKFNGERVYWPNPSLFDKSVINWTRSKNKVEVVRLLLDVGIPWEVREDIENSLKAHAADKPTEFEGMPACNFAAMDNPLKIVMTASWTYSFPPDEFKRLVPARNSMMHVLQSKLREHDLKHTVQEVHDLEKVPMSTNIPDSANVKPKVD